MSFFLFISIGTLSRHDSVNVCTCVCMSVCLSFCSCTCLCVFPLSCIYLDLVASKCIYIANSSYVITIRWQEEIVNKLSRNIFVASGKKGPSVCKNRHNGIKHEYMIPFCNCKQAKYLLLTFFTKSCQIGSLFPPKRYFFIYFTVIFSINTSWSFLCFLNGNRFSKTVSYYLILRPKQ